MSLHFITDLGDQAVILPLVLATGLALLLAGWWRGAAAWFLAIPGTLGVVLVAKLSTSACQSLMPPIDLFSPSGHTASAAAVYGGMLALAFGASRQRLLLAALSGLATATLVGFSRYALEVHTLADVLAGGLLGSIGTIALSLLAGPRPTLRRSWIGMAAAMLAIVVLFHGRHVYAEMHINRVAPQIWPLTLCAAR